jgi:eukaryotic-like serine/threonine-protein kinase
VPCRSLVEVTTSGNASRPWFSTAECYRRGGVVRLRAVRGRALGRMFVCASYHSVLGLVRFARNNNNGGTEGGNALLILRPRLTEVVHLTLEPGSRLGPYEISAALGAGGMGEVYAAKDLRLGRRVALKVLAAARADSAAWRARFQDEARAIARLNHPHICQLYDVGHDREMDFLVMEYLQGKTLAATLKHSALPLPRVLEYGIQLADALDCAHNHGIIHRDLKPSNVILTKALGIKVLDFGLAKLRAIESDDVTKSALDTARNVIIGTLAYMSPEQLEGKRADVRSDIFAMGLVLQEMATGRRVFDAPSEAALIAAILSGEPPPVSSGQPLAPSALDWLLSRCLAKEPDERWQHARDVAAGLRWIASDPKPDQRIRSPRSATRRYTWPLAATALLVSLLAIVAYLPRLSATAPFAPGIAFAVYPPPLGAFTLTPSSVRSSQFAISPDGKQLVFVASVAGVSQLWLRSIDSLEARRVAGTVGASYPFWSPGSDSVAFFSERVLKRVDLAGGPARILAATPNGRGGTWNEDGDILFAPDGGGGLFRVGSTGGSAVPVTTVDAARGEQSHRWPSFLPDNRTFTYFTQSSRAETQGIYIGALNSSEHRLLVATHFSGRYAPPGYLLYVSDRTLMARALSLSGSLSGEPVPIAERAGGSSNFHAAFSVSNTGVLALEQSTGAGSELVWFNRAGAPAGKIMSLTEYVDFELSPDQQQIAIAEVDAATEHSTLVVQDIRKGNSLRLTYSQATDASPVWSPDGSRIAFRSNRAGRHDLYIVNANGGRKEEPLLQDEAAKFPTDWVDNQILFQRSRGDTAWDIWMTSTAAGKAPRPLVQTRFDEIQGRVSPDGKWIAYASNETGRFEIYVQEFPVTGAKWRVSNSGGSDPKWRGDGNELFYVSLDGSVMAASVRPNARFEADPPERLIGAALPNPVEPFTSNYTVTKDGERFLVKVPSERAPIVVLVGWAARVRDRISPR